MKTTTGSRIRLGLFVILGVALFLAAIYIIGDRQQLFSETFHIHGLFKDVTGLQVGNNVRLAGINVGTVDDITIISDTSVKVELVIAKKVRKFIQQDASVVISSDGLMGNKLVTINPGSNNTKPITDNATIKTVPAVSLDDIFGKMKTTSDNAAQITSDLAVITGNVREGKGTIGTLFMDTTFAENLDKTIVNVKNGAGGFSQNMTALKSNFLFKGYYKKKDKEAEKAQKEAEKQKEKEDKKNK